MNVHELHSKLIAAARQQRPRDSVPYGFERRIINRLKGLGVPDVWGLWAGALWRAAAPCVVLALAVTAWSLLNNSSGVSSGDLSQEFENTVLAAANFDQPPAEPLR